jgi:hypothetical protein
MSAGAAADDGVERDGRVPARNVERRLWFALLTPMIAWSAAELVGVALIGNGCGDESSGFGGGRWIAMLATNAVAAVLSAAAAIAAFRTFVAWSRSSRIATAPGADRVDFMAQLGFFVSLLLLFNIVMFGVAPLIVHPCAGGGS